MTTEPRSNEDAKKSAAAAKRRLHSTLIAVESRLTQPYPDRPESSPWTVFVRPMIDVVDAAIDSLAAERTEAVARAQTAEQELAHIRRNYEAMHEAHSLTARRAERAEAQLQAVTDAHGALTSRRRYTGEPWAGHWQNGFDFATQQIGRALAGAAVSSPTSEPADEPSLDWKPGDPCGSCGSTDTGWNHELGGHCRTCLKADSDEGPWGARASRAEAQVAAVRALIDDENDDWKFSVSMIRAALASRPMRREQCAIHAPVAAGVTSPPEQRVCESGCGCRYGTDDPDVRDCACDGPCAMADPSVWGCNPALGGCGGDCPTCPPIEPDLLIVNGNVDRRHRLGGPCDAGCPCGRGVVASEMPPEIYDAVTAALTPLGAVVTPLLDGEASPPEQPRPSITEELSQLAAMCQQEGGEFASRVYDEIQQLILAKESA